MNPFSKVIAAEPERTNIRSSVEIRLAPPDMTEQHACPGAPESFWRPSQVSSATIGADNGREYRQQCEVCAGKRSCSNHECCTTDHRRHRGRRGEGGGRRTFGHRYYGADGSS